MMNLIVDLSALMLFLTLLVCALAAWRIGHVVSWRALATTAWATHSFTECVAFIRFCADERDLMTENGPRTGEIRSRPESRHEFEEWPRVS